MNPMEELELLKERVSRLEQMLLRKPHLVSKQIAQSHQHEIAERSKLFVAEYFKFNVAALAGASRQMRFVWPRWIAIHLSYKYSGLRKEDIGRVFNRHHTAVIHALKGLQIEMETNALRRDEVLLLEAQFQALVKAPPALAA